MSPNMRLYLDIVITENIYAEFIKEVFFWKKGFILVPVVQGDSKKILSFFSISCFGSVFLFLQFCLLFCLLFYLFGVLLTIF